MNPARRPDRVRRRFAPPVRRRSRRRQCVRCGRRSASVTDGAPVPSMMRAFVIRRSKGWVGCRRCARERQQDCDASAGQHGSKHVSSRRLGARHRRNLPHGARHRGSNCSAVPGTMAKNCRAVPGTVAVYLNGETVDHSGSRSDGLPARACCTTGVPARLQVDANPGIGIGTEPRRCRRRESLHAGRAIR